MDTITHVTRELTKLHDFDPATQAKINWDIINVANTLNDAGHLNPEQNTGRYIADVLTRVLALKPLTELTGQDDEWDFVHPECTSELTVMYNKRCPSIVKRINNATKEVEVVDYGAVVISSDGGLTWWEPERCYASVQFPYFPPIVPSNLFVKQLEEDKFEVISDEAEIEAVRLAAIEDMKAAEEGEEAEKAASMPIEGMMGGMNGAIPPISPEQMPSETEDKEVITADTVIDAEEEDCILVTAEDDE